MIKIEHLKEQIPVYDITVEDNHNFFANDILVHNCSEILLPSRASEFVSEELITTETGKKIINKQYTAGEIALCNLSSINLERWFYMDEQERMKLVRTVVRALDNTVDIANYPVKEGKHSNTMYRYLGIGVLNYTNYLALKHIVIDTQDAAEETDKLFDDISYKIITASMELAIEKGRFEKFYETEWSDGVLPIHKANKKAIGLTKYVPDMEKWNKLADQVKIFGLRNAQLMAIAPTACCAKNTRIKTTDGIMSFEDIMNEQGIDHVGIELEAIPKWIEFKTPVEISTRFGDKWCNHIWYNGKQPVRTITLNDEKFAFTLNHKLLVKQFNGVNTWVKIKDMREGIQIVQNSKNTIEISKIEDGLFKHTWDIEVSDVHEYLLSNDCISHNTSGKGINAIESTEPIHSFFYKEEGTITVPTVVPNFRKNNQYYKTAFECNQKSLLKNAAVRQKWLDQSQSVNIYISTPDSLLEMVKLHLWYFDHGGKTLYYQKSQKDTSDHVCESCS